MDMDMINHRGTEGTEGAQRGAYRGVAVGRKFSRGLENALEGRCSQRPQIHHGSPIRNHFSGVNPPAFIDSLWHSRALRAAPLQRLFATLLPQKTTSKRAATSTPHRPSLCTLCALCASVVNAFLSFPLSLHRPAPSPCV